MKKITTHSGAVGVVLLLAVLLLSGCFAKKIMADDALQAPAAKQITDKLFNSTVGHLIVQPQEVGEVWLLPTPTPVPDDLFDKVFGKAREMLPTPAPVVVQQTERWGTVTVPGLNVRRGPGADTAVIAGLTQDQRVKIEDEAEGWLQVALPDGQKGWSSAEFMIVEEIVVAPVAAATPQPEQADATAATTGEKGIVLADALNVRSQPNMAGEIVASLGRWECVDVVGEQDGWYQIAMPSVKSGWSIGEYIQPSDACPTPGPVDTTAVGGSESASRAGAATPAQSAVAEPVAAEPVTNVNYAQQPMVANAAVVQETKMHECFGGGWDEIRFVSSNTPVEVIGTGPWAPPAGQEGEVGPGPYLKIRIWDGQYGWIAASAVGIDIQNAAQISGQCEAGDRIDWGTVVQPTPRPMPRPVATPRPVSTSTTVRYPTTTTGTNTAITHDHKYRDE